MKRQSDEEKAKKIEIQVERWDLFAKLAPALFLVLCFILLLTGNTTFETVFFAGMLGFSLTAVVWWFWTIYSIRFLVKLFNKATQDLIDTGEELKAVRKELRDAQSNSIKLD